MLQSLAPEIKVCLTARDIWSLARTILKFENLKNDYSVAHVSLNAHNVSEELYQLRNRTRIFILNEAGLYIRIKHIDFSPKVSFSCWLVLHLR